MSRRTLSHPLARAVAVGLTTAGLAAAVVVGVPAAASAAPPITVTQPSVSFTMPSTSFAKNYAGIKIDLSTVPDVFALRITVNCRGTAPIRAFPIVTDQNRPTDVTFIVEAPLSVSGTSCTVSGTSTIARQSVVFAPGSYISLDKGLRITTVHGLVVAGSRNGGL